MRYLVYCSINAGEKVSLRGTATTGEKMKTEQVVHISAPDFGVLELVIHGTAPLVIHRFSKKIDLMANYVDLLKPEAA